MFEKKDFPRVSKIRRSWVVTTAAGAQVFADFLSALASVWCGVEQ